MKCGRVIWVFQLYLLLAHKKTLLFNLNPGALFIKLLLDLNATL